MCVSRGGVRLDAALVDAYPTTTRAFVREAIASGSVEVDGRRVVKGLKLKGGEIVTIRSLAEACDNVVMPNPDIHPVCVYEDAALLAYDKPAGMPVQPLARAERMTLMNGVVVCHPECQSLGDRPLMAGALHRIDADTSGLVLVARHADAFENLRAQFSSQCVEKTYLALVEGAVAVGGTLENELVHDPTLPFCRMIDFHNNRLTRAQCAHLRPLPARTTFRPLRRERVENEERTLLEITIFTGVTHQIRAQLALAGMHIVNDRLYGAFAVEHQVGHCLHAWRARFKQPVTGVPIALGTPYPAWARTAASTAIVSLGSNVEPRADYLEKALAALAFLPHTHLKKASRVIETEPMDVPEAFADRKFLNQVAVLETTLDPHDFSRRMHQIEDDLGRIRTVRNGPRTIDIDLIDMDGLALNEPDLTLPHPRASSRPFVMQPLAELGLYL